MTLLPSTSTTTVDTGVWILTQGTPRTNATGFWAASEIDGTTTCEGAGERGATDAENTGEAKASDAEEVTPAGDAVRGETGRAKGVATTAPDGD